jgi:hypothetical protein
LKNKQLEESSSSIKFDFKDKSSSDSGDNLLNEVKDTKEPSFHSEVIENKTKEEQSIHEEAKDQSESIHLENDSNREPSFQKDIIDSNETKEPSIEIKLEQHSEEEQSKEINEIIPNFEILPSGEKRFNKFSS